MRTLKATGILETFIRLQNNKLIKTGADIFRCPSFIRKAISDLFGT